MKFHFVIVPHKRQRYDTVGDYFRMAGSIQRLGGWVGSWVFSVSRMSDRRYCWLVFLHEIIEWSICRLTGAKMRDIDRFDIAYEKARDTGHAPCGCLIDEEPGDDVHAPYHDAHLTATACEKLIARALAVDWIKYADVIQSLSYGTSEKKVRKNL